MKKNKVAIVRYVVEIGRYDVAVIKYEFTIARYSMKLQLRDIL